MANYFEKVMMEGFSKYLKHKASEELSIALEIQKFLISKGKRYSFLNIDEHNFYFKNASSVFFSILSNEEKLLNKTKKLYLIAKQENNKDNLDFVSKLLNTRKKNTKIATDIVYKIKNENLAFLQTITCN